MRYGSLLQNAQGCQNKKILWRTEKGLLEKLIFGTTRDVKCRTKVLLLRPPSAAAPQAAVEDLGWRERPRLRSNCLRNLRPPPSRRPNPQVNCNYRVEHKIVARTGGTLSAQPCNWDVSLKLNTTVVEFWTPRNTTFTNICEIVYISLLYSQIP